MATTPPLVEPIYSSLPEEDHLNTISPSKARQAASTARSWSFVDSRLVALYSPNQVPSFERNDDTLQALLALVRANEVADEEHLILHRARQEELEVLEASTNVEHGDSLSPQPLLHEIEASLDSTAQSNLDEIANAAVQMGDMYTTPLEMGKHIIDLTQSNMTARSHLDRLGVLQHDLERQISEMQLVLDQARSQRELESQKVEKMQQERSLWDREVKQLKFKLAEYRERVSGLERYAETVRSPRLEDLVGREKTVHGLQRSIEQLEERIQGFGGLPPDLEAAKGEVARAKNELQSLIQQREDLFTTMVG